MACFHFYPDLPFAREHLRGADQAAQQFAGAVHVGRQRGFEVGDEFPIALDGIDQVCGYGIVRRALLGHHRCAFGLSGLQPGLQGRGNAHGRDRVGKALQLAVELCQALARLFRPGRTLGPDPGEDLGHGLLQIGERGRAHQLLADQPEQTVIHRCALGRNALAHGRASVLAVCAAVVPAAGGDHRTAAMAAAQEAAEHRFWGASSATAAALACRPAHAQTHCVPLSVRDNPQLGALGNLPFIARAIEPSALAGVRIFHPLTAVPDVAPDVELVVQHARALRRTAVQRRHRPGAAAAGLDAAPVQIGRNPLAAPAGGVLVIDPPHHLGIGRDNLQALDVAIGYRPVAKGQSAHVAAPGELASLTTVRLVAQIVEVDLVDQAAHRAVDLLSAGLGIVSVRHADDADAAMLQTADDSLLLDLVAG